jgi:hypothetical protein
MGTIFLCSVIFPPFFTILFQPGEGPDVAPELLVYHLQDFTVNFLKFKILPILFCVSHGVGFRPSALALFLEWAVVEPPAKVKVFK